MCIYVVIIFGSYMQEEKNTEKEEKKLRISLLGKKVHSFSQNKSSLLFFFSKMNSHMKRFIHTKKERQIKRGQKSTKKRHTHHHHTYTYTSLFIYNLVFVFKIIWKLHLLQHDRLHSLSN